METQEQDLIVVIKPDMAKLYPTAEAVDAALRRLWHEQERRTKPSPLTESYNAAYADDTPEEIEEERRLLQGMKRKTRAVLDPW